MWCAGCGKPLVPLHETAWKLCCKDKGYWSTVEPLARDAWALDRKVWRKEIKAYLYLYRFPK